MNRRLENSDESGSDTSKYSMYINTCLPEANFVQPERKSLLSSAKCIVTVGQGRPTLSQPLPEPKDLNLGQN